MIEKIISDLEKMSGKNEKIDYLKNLSDKKLIKDILYYVYNPFQMYYVKKVKGLNFTGTKKITEKNWNEYKKILNQLNERTISGNNALDMLRNFLSEFSENSGNILLGVLKKKLPIKMNTEINKAFPNLVPNFDVILANKLEAKVSDKGVLQVEKLPFNKNYISRKLDGLRMITIKGEKDVETYSRNGLKYQHFDKIKKSISNISLANIVLDGEVVMMDDNKNENFQSIVSICHTKKASENDENAKYLIFDIIKTDEFYSQSKTVSFIERSKILKSSFGADTQDTRQWILPTDYENIFIVNHPEVHSVEELKKAFSHSQENGWEGIMIRNGNSPYEFKRSKNLLKIKAFMDDEFPIVGYFEGRDDFKNMFGGFYCEVDKKQYKPVKCGSGFSIKERKTIWKQIIEFEKKNNLERKDHKRLDMILKEKDISKHPYIGKELTIKFQGYSKNKEEEKSLRFPTVKMIDRKSVEGAK